MERSTDLAPYLSRIATGWDQLAGTAASYECDGSLCFVDISGFTALSERLARRGRVGAEELTGVLDYVFSHMLDITYNRGGSLLKFGGDALLLAFFDDDHAHAAASAAVEMRAALREARTSPVGRLTLRMSVGINTGPLHFFRVGRAHHEVLVAGPGASMTARMEQAADAGEIVVSAEAAARLPKRAAGDAKGDGRLLRWRNVLAAAPRPPHLRDPDPDLVEASVPVRLRDHLRAGGGRSEHRVASVGFVKFQGVDDFLRGNGVDATADALDAIVTTVQAAAEEEGVTFLASDIDANGGKIILVTGVPSAQDDDEGRLLRAARSIADTALPLPVRIGVNRGHVFAGEIGTTFRRTYTVMGDTVNVAARLMAAASPGELYASPAILDRSRTTFDLRRLEPLSVKGKSEPLTAYAVNDATGVQGSSASALPFVGRQPELDDLEELATIAADGAGQVVLIEAERGAGKTRLVQELLERHPMTTLLLQGEPFATATPYLPWRAPLRALLDVDTPDRARAGAQLARAVAVRAPDLAGLAPLMATMLDVDLEPTRESARIAPEFRRDRLAELVVAMLDAVPGPLTIVADDAHWFDDATSAVLHAVVGAANMQRWLCVITRRVTDTGFRPEKCNQQLLLRPITDDVSRTLVDDMTRNLPLRPEERDRLVTRAAGNPLFLEELLRVVRVSGADELPDSLDAVVVREIDALPPIARVIVSYAAVLGRTFRADLLRELLARDELELDASYLAALDQHLDRDGMNVHFRHALIQEAAYERLPFRVRRALHERAGAAIEELGERAVDDVSSSLSLHAFRAEDWPRTWEHARTAGIAAAERYAPLEAVTHFERAVVAARRLPKVDADGHVALLRELAEAAITIGDYTKADDALRQATRALGDDMIGRARVHERRSYVQGEHQGRLGPAIRQIRRGLALVDALGAPTPVGRQVRAQLLAREALIRFRQGRLRDATILCGQVMVDAEALGEQRALATAMSVLDAALFELGRPDEAVYTSRALLIYEALGDRIGVARTLGNLGGMALYQSNWVKAASYFTRAAEVAREAGDVSTAALCDVNLAEVRVNQGQLAEAESLLVPALHTMRALCYTVNVAMGAIQLGRVRGYTGRTDDALGLLREAAQIYETIGADAFAAEAHARAAEVALLAGDRSTAATELDIARRGLRALDDSPAAALVQQIAGMLDA